MLIKYITKNKAVRYNPITGQAIYPKSEKIGVVVAIGKNQIGWSLCDPCDTFDKVKGIEIAVLRARLNAATGNNKNIPNKILQEVCEMECRSIKYYK